MPLQRHPIAHARPGPRAGYEPVQAGRPTAIRLAALPEAQRAVEHFIGRAEDEAGAGKA